MSVSRNPNCVVTATWHVAMLTINVPGNLRFAWHLALLFSTLTQISKVDHDEPRISEKVTHVTNTGTQINMAQNSEDLKNH